MATDQREIEVKDASLQTATISIRTLQVNNKQMTLAVFRQLQSWDGLDNEGCLYGDVWGWVNYHPDCAKEDMFHRDFIWYKRDLGEIFRGKMYSPILKSIGEFTCEFTYDNKSELSQHLRHLAALGDYDAHAAICRNITRSWDAIENAGQLFIAV